MPRLLNTKFGQHSLPATGGWSLVIGHRSWVVGPCLIGHLELVICHIGRWSSVIRHRSSVVGQWSVVISPERVIVGLDIAARSGVALGLALVRDGQGRTFG